MTPDEWSRAAWDSAAWWELWAAGVVRCAYCIGEPWDSFRFICDCFQSEAEAHARDGFVFPGDAWCAL